MSDNKRNYMIVTFSVDDADKQKLDDLCVYATEKSKKVITRSQIIRWLINLGVKHKENINFLS